MSKKKHQAKAAAMPAAAPMEDQAPKEPFDQWWSAYRGTNGYPHGLRVAVEAHMKARGFWDSRNWEAGILDFGHGRQA